MGVGGGVCILHSGDGDDDGDDDDVDKSGSPGLQV